MSETVPQRYSVHVVAESDDFDGVASIGMAYRSWTGVVQVLVRDNAGGWWDGEQVPYLVFFRGTRPSAQEAEAVVRQALKADTVETAGPGSNSEGTYLSSPNAYAEVSLNDPDCFAEMASHGLKWGWFYPYVMFRPQPDGAVHLLFFRDPDDLPSDEFDLDAIIDSLP